MKGIKHSESIFRYNIKNELIIGVLLVGLLIILLLINHEYGNIPAYLNRNDVNVFDRWLMLPYAEPLDNIVYAFLAVALTLPVILPLAINMKNKGVWLKYVIMYAQAFLFTFGVRTILKDIINRYRPYMYFEGFLISNDFYNSFPSGSTALAFLPATFLSVTFSVEFPNSPWKIPVIIGSYTLAICIGATRIFSGTHFLTDVLAGAVIGIFFGWVIPALHKKTNNI